MYKTVKKGTQFHAGEYIGANENDELYKGIVVLLVTGLKKTQYRQLLKPVLK